MFPHSRVKEIASGILEEQLKDMTYSSNQCKEKALTLSEMILASIKKLPMERYKIVCDVLIGQNGGQSMVTASRCAWDEKTDNFASVSYENRSIYAVATVYGLYTE